MKPHPRIRKTIKWSGAAMTVLLVVVWIGSGWFDYIGVRSTYWVGLGHGTLRLGDVPSAYELRDSSELVVSEHFKILTILPSWQVRISKRSVTTLPLWIPAVCTLLITLVPPFLDIRSRRRAKLNLCPKCHYDRTGLRGGAKCPECGSTPP